MPDLRGLPCSSITPSSSASALAPLDAGRKVADIGAGLDVSATTICNWRNRHLIDTGQ